MPTKIEWTQETWNPITGCTKVSEGCRNCYAERMARRLAGRYGYPEAPHHFDVALHPDKLEQPLRWKKPRTVFVCSMGDLFHEDVPTDFIQRVFAVAALCPSHTFQVLTKRAARMLVQLNSKTFERGVRHIYTVNVLRHRLELPREIKGWPLPNVWPGVSVENQETANERIPLLLQTPAAVRFVSCEPLLGAVDLSPWLTQRWSHGYSTPMSRRLGTNSSPVPKPRLDWVIVGGESGPGARPMNPDWARSVRDQCQAAEIPFFFKQWGKWWPHEQGQWVSEAEQYIGPDWGDDEFYPIGKKAAGRLLDGRTWNEMPITQEAK